MVAAEFKLERSQDSQEFTLEPRLQSKDSLHLADLEIMTLKGCHM